MIDELEVLQAIGDIDPPSSSVFEQARLVFEDLVIGHEDRRPAFRRGRLRPSRPHLIAACIVAIAAVAAFALLGGVVSAPKLATSSAAAAVLTAAARTAATRSSSTLPGPGQYVYTKNIETFLNQQWVDNPAPSTYSVFETQTTQRWTVNGQVGVAAGGQVEVPAFSGFRRWWFGVCHRLVGC
ncbi:MAG TPA: hypothetical protein VHT30_02205 [Acidimicrobiales bacterium]|nr:hypothetical protein [Acidimicrobiales bacterium]